MIESLKLENLTDSELIAKYTEYLARYELSGGTQFVTILEVIKREKGRRFHSKYKRKHKNGAAREADARARLLFHN